MPFALLAALAVSLGLHLAALFLTDVDVTAEPDPPPLLAELKPLPLPEPPVSAMSAAPAETPKVVVKPAPPAKKKPRRQAESKPAAQPSASSVLTVPAETPAAVVPEPAAVPVDEMTGDSTGTAGGAGDPSGFVPEPVVASQPLPVLETAPPLPERGRIVYRVDRGDSNFEIGRARQEWEIADGRYRLRSVVETTGLVWLFKAYSVEMESRGEVTGEGLRPDSFAIRRNGQEAREKAIFDWAAMTVSVADHAPQPLANGAQDLLSFNYQLRFMALPESGGVLMLATGKKYAAYRLEVLGDETVVVPAGTLHTLHLRAPGINTTELWLAYDYLMLPVKIRHVDNKGNSLVQVATEIQLSQE
ncbi:MAG: DUF3108 domain-containing protein [Propionivibrio sp.]